MRHILNTGQTRCYNSKGQETSCLGYGHDGEIQTGIPWTAVRFTAQKEVVVDNLTDLVWTRNANIGTFPCTWQESYEQIADLNQERYGDYGDWRLPHRNELRSLVSYQTKKPALPEGHPFINIFLGWYWTSTTAASHPAYAWSVHLEGARMFYGKKEQYQLFWPVRGTGNTHLPATGQYCCYDVLGNVIDCFRSGQDGALQHGSDWPQPRFIKKPDIIHNKG